MILVLVALSSFLFGIFIGITYFPYLVIEEKDEEFPQYRHWKGQTYEVLYTFVLDADNLERMVVYRAKYGKKTVYVMKSSKFHGTVKNYQGEEVKRFVLL